MDLHTLETLYGLLGEERMPRSRLVKHMVRFATGLDRDTWVRKVDLALVGGDPLVLTLRLIRALRSREADRIAVIMDPDTSLAPLAALNDRDVVQDLVDHGVLPGSISAPRGEIRGGAVAVLRRAVEDLSSHLEVRPISGFLATGPAQAARVAHRGRILLRLSEEGGRDLVRPSDGDGGQVYDQSRDLGKIGRRLFEGAVSGVLRRPTARRCSHRVFDAARCEVLSGFLSPGFGGQARIGLAFMREDLDADLFNLAGPYPDSLRDALDLWRRDLKLASRTHVQSSKQGATK